MQEDALVKDILLLIFRVISFRDVVERWMRRGGRGGWREG